MAQHYTHQRAVGVYIREWDREVGAHICDARQMMGSRLGEEAFEVEALPELERQKQMVARIGVEG